MVTLTITNDRSEILIDLQIFGQPTLQEAIAEITRMFAEDEINGEIACGPWKVTNASDHILFENNMLGGCLPHDDIVKAIRVK